MNTLSDASFLIYCLQSQMMKKYTEHAFLFNYGSLPFTYGNKATKYEGFICSNSNFFKDDPFRVR